MKNVHTLPVTVTYNNEVTYDFPEPKACIGEEALLEKIRLGLPSIVYRKLGELFGDSLRGFHIEYRLEDELTLQTSSTLYYQVTLSAEEEFLLDNEFTNWWLDYVYDHMLNFVDLPVICVKFVSGEQN